MRKAERERGIIAVHAIVQTVRPFAHLPNDLYWLFRRPIIADYFKHSGIIFDRRNPLASIGTRRTNGSISASANNSCGAAHRMLDRTGLKFCKPASVSHSGGISMVMVIGLQLRPGPSGGARSRRAPRRVFSDYPLACLLCSTLMFGPDRSAAPRQLCRDITTAEVARIKSAGQAVVQQPTAAQSRLCPLRF